MGLVIGLIVIEGAQSCTFGGRSHRFLRRPHPASPAVRPLRLCRRPRFTHLPRSCRSTAGEWQRPWVKGDGKNEWGTRRWEREPVWRRGASLKRGRVWRRRRAWHRARPCDSPWCWLRRRLLFASSDISQCAAAVEFIGSQDSGSFLATNVSACADSVTRLVQASGFPAGTCRQRRCEKVCPEWDSNRCSCSPGWAWAGRRPPCAGSLCCAPWGHGTRSSDRDDTA